MMQQLQWRGEIIVEVFGWQDNDARIVVVAVIDDSEKIRSRRSSSILIAHSLSNYACLSAFFV